MNPEFASAIKEKVRRLPESPGVYLMKDRLGTILYVGKAKSLKKRVSSYFQPSRRFTLAQPKVAAMIELVADVEIVEVRSEAEALLLEGRLIKEWKPRYNTDFVDDKRFPMVRADVTAELPRFRVVRFPKEDGARYFGPFPHSGLLRKTLAEMRRRFGILLADGTPKRHDDGRWELYGDARAELYGHEPVVTADDYRKRVDEACSFLEGRTREWLEDLRKEMKEAAGNLEFEKAAGLRDAVEALERTLEKTRKFNRESVVFNRARLEAGRGVEELRLALAMATPPKRCECFDISHISGSFCVASMVAFDNGRPDRPNYRRFKVRSFEGNDDFRAMQEVVGRRYRRIAEEDRPPPELVVIDGGRGQVAAALKGFAEHGLEPPMLIGLAKKEETIIFCDERAPLRLPAHHEGLRLLQRMRDEAHRFANTFNADLRSQRLRETVLDEIPGLGPSRRKALLAHFGTIEKLRAATLEDIAAVEGFGPVQAAKIREFLDQAD